MASKRHGGSNGFLEVSASILLLVNLLIHLSSIEDVIAAGKERGAQRADLYGCLYFYLSKQLRMFSSRIKRFRIKFHMLDRDARALAKDLRSGVLESQGLPKSIRFDRIDVSNVIDNYYIGLPNVLSDWGPFLSGTNPCATLLGYSMNWVPAQFDATAQPKDIKRLVPQLLAQRKVSHSSPLSLKLRRQWI